MIARPYSKTAALAIAGLGIWLIAYRAWSHRHEGDFDTFDDTAVTVTRIIDGDTFRALHPSGDGSTITVRIWGIDTPELSGCQGGPCHWALQAKAELIDLIDDESVTLQLEGYRCRGVYDRLLAHVWRSSAPHNVALHLVENGHAFADPRWHHEHETAYESAEAEAYADGLGMFNDFVRVDAPGWWSPPG